MSDIACIVKIDLTNMDAEMRSAKVNSLLKEGYEIKSTTCYRRWKTSFINSSRTKTRKIYG